MSKIQSLNLLAIGVVAGCTHVAPVDPTPQWTPIFDGETLDGWTPKIVGQSFGEDENRIFRVENNTLVVSYDGYSTFGGEFGHLFFEQPASTYRLRFEYQFRGAQVADGPGWALMNSGVMVHAQAPETMGVDQAFPVSVEAQLLGRPDSLPDRTTANICTPGTHIVVAGTLTRQHCINSNTRAAPAGEWVNFEIEVRAGTLMRLSINGEEAFTLTTPEYDSADTDAARLGLTGPVEQGYFALQAESHPVAFRNIELLRLD